MLFFSGNRRNCYPSISGNWDSVQGVISSTSNRTCFGEDQKLVWTSSNVNRIHEMLQGTNNYCGIPMTPSTAHCFHDDTHRTCCLLGGKARRYAEQSGNPNGRASEEAFFQRFGFYPDENTLTPWCTCIGSMVCSFYIDKFKDGTHIKYMDTTTKHPVSIRVKE